MAPARRDPLPSGLEEPSALPVARSPEEDRAVVRATAQRVRQQAEQTIERAELAQAEAKATAELAIHALAEADGLRRAMQTRSYIDMAKGVLIAIHGISEDEAFEQLVAVSRQRGVKLVEVARELVTAMQARARDR